MILTGQRNTKRHPQADHPLEFSIRGRMMLPSNEKRNREQYTREEPDSNQNDSAHFGQNAPRSIREIMAGMGMLNEKTHSVPESLKEAM